MARDSDGSAEDRLIARYFKPLAKHPGTFGFTDDASAITPPAGHDLVLKTDGLIAGVHFFPDDPADGVARKALRVNLSDLAAKGAAPLGFLLAIALPKGFDESWLADFARGLGEDADAYECPLLGGDTDSTPGPTGISIAAFGTLADGHDGAARGREGGRPCVRQRHDRRCGARAAGAERRGGSWKLDAATSEHLVARYRLPQPRNALAEAVRTHASAAMDVSDGLAADLAKLCRISDVSADIEVARVPLSAAARAGVARRRRADRADPDRRRGLRDPMRGVARKGGALSPSRPRRERPGHRHRPNRRRRCAAALSRRERRAAALYASRLQSFLSVFGASQPRDSPQ